MLLASAVPGFHVSRDRSFFGRGTASLNVARRDGEFGSIPKTADLSWSLFAILLLAPAVLRHILSDPVLIDHDQQALQDIL